MMVDALLTQAITVLSSSLNRTDELSLTTRLPAIPQSQENCLKALRSPTKLIH